jgi:RimJ/RimL family protein N-acetyltransferase
MKRKYLCLNKQIYKVPPYSLIPIRDEDKYIIMEMRNEQIYHLRQETLLIAATQEKYFATAITPLFEQHKPNQILFSFLHNNECIGYGGLVHINWVDKHAEISFIIKPSLEKEYFHICWTHFLTMLDDVAFNQLQFHKIFTYAFDIRPHVYQVLEENNYKREATLKEHCFFENKFIDVVIHSKIKTNR